MRIYIRYFLGIDVEDYPIDSATILLSEAHFVRELQVGVLREAIVKAIDGDR